MIPAEDPTQRFTNPFPTAAYYVETIREERRAKARLVAALENIRDEAAPGTTTHSIAVRALEEAA